MSALEGYMHVLIVGEEGLDLLVVTLPPARHLVKRDPLDFNPLDIGTTLCGRTGRLTEEFTIRNPLCRKCLDIEMRPTKEEA